MYLDRRHRNGVSFTVEIKIPAFIARLDNVSVKFYGEAKTMYVTDVEDIDDEQEDEKWEKEATGPNLKGTNKPLMTQSIHFENNLRNSSARFVKDTTRSIHTEDGSSLNVVDGQLSAADSAENNEAKNIYEKNLRATLAYYTGKSSLKSEGISKDVRETREGEGYDNLESGESRLNSGKPVVSFQSTSGEYSVSRSSNGELLILVNGELYRHVKEVCGLTFECQTVTCIVLG